MERYDKRYQRHSYSLWFYTLSLPCFDQLYNLFYANGYKEIPVNVANYLTPISLSYWLSEFTLRLVPRVNSPRYLATVGYRGGP